MKLIRVLAIVLCALALLPATARAHVGSKDVFEETTAGPYKLFVTIRPPDVIPGVAAVEVRSSGAPATSIAVTPLTLTGAGSEHGPTPDPLKRSSVDPNFFTGSVWMMETGSMQVRFDVNGVGGRHAAAVPVASIALKSLKMQRALSWTLVICGIVLVFGMGGIAGAAVREARLAPGATPTPSLRRRGLIVSAATVLLCLGLMWVGDKWWKVDAANFADTLYKPLTVSTTVNGDHLRMLIQAHSSARADQTRSNADFILDHGQPMHLYVVREPQLDAVYHLHPKFVHAGEFDLNLPTMPPGKYTLYGDVVHANGFPETLVSTIDLPHGIQGRALTAVDAEGHPAPLSAGELGPRYKLPDGYTMVWDKPATLTVNTAYAFHFELLGPDGKPAQHMRTYLGMAGHAAFLKTDGTVFAHVHPAGSAAMAAVMLADNQGATPAGEGSGGMAGMGEAAETDLTSNAVEFPYGFPSPGRYRIFVQMKHDSTVETGVFDAVVQ